MPSPRLTRRKFLGVATATAAVTLAGCASAVVRTSAPTATPFSFAKPVSFYADETVPVTLADHAVTLLGRAAGITAGITRAASLATSPDLLLTYGSPPASYIGAAIGASPTTLFTHLRVPVDEVTANHARALLSGTLRDWQGAGAPYGLTAMPLTLAGLPYAAGWAPTASARKAANAGALLDALRTTPGALALAPVEYADWTVRNVGVDGAYAAQGRGALTNNPAGSFTLTLAARADLVRSGLKLAALAAALAPTLASITPVVDLAVVGDIMLGRTVNDKMVAYHDYLYPYRKTRDELLSADLRVANLECTVTDTAPIPTDPYTFTFVTSKRAVDGLVYGGFDALTVANNHADGCGPGALLDMLANLRGAGIAVTGGGSSLDEARQPAVVASKGVLIAILGYDMIPPQGAYATASSAGLAPVDLATLPHDIAAARAKADLVIPYFHWGIEYTEDPTVDQQRTARAAIDAGADMVLGNHPHWIQGIENYKGKLIIYSFGNFIFDQNWSRPTLEGLLIHLYWRGGKLVSMRFVPTLDEDMCQPRIMSQAEAVDSFARLWSATDMLASGRYGP
jgi:poly-gamma-glutamate capsule biosynthesis protein CapA/YwtB (metallophosphatase superfamily)